jgi:hypothetical protein
MKLCIDCNKNKKIHALNRCCNCYKKFRYNNNPKIKQKMLDNSKKWRINNYNKLKEIQNNWNNKNPDFKKNYHKNYYKINKEKIIKQNKKYYLKNRDKKIKQSKEYIIKNRDKYNKWYINWEKNKLKNDISYKFIKNLRSRNNSAFKGIIKTKSCIKSLGCTPEFFKLYLLRQFDDKMTFSNYGTYWHIDHIIPISSGKTIEEKYLLNHYTNLQPLEAGENLRKGAKI